jgi:cyanuric acid amidohydrolase
MLDIAIAYPDGPGDVRSLQTWLGRLHGRKIARLVVLGKTEGPATLNDFSRDVAQAAIDAAIAEAAGDLSSRAWRLFSTGCEGIASPITVMMADISEPRPSAEARGLAIGVARSGPLPSFPRCGLEHIDAAAATVRTAMDDAGLRHDQVALVLIKSPILAPGCVPADAPAGRRHAGTRIMAFSGIETQSIEVVVLGERPGGDPRWGIVGRLMSDWLDTEAISHMRRATGKPELIFFKAGIAPDGRLSGRRTTVFTSDLSADKHLRAAASGFLTAHFGNTATFISGGAEHQAPPGGCICAALCRRN